MLRMARVSIILLVLNYMGSEMLEGENKWHPGNIYFTVSLFDKY